MTEYDWVLRRTIYRQRNRGVDSHFRRCFSCSSSIVSAWSSSARVASTFFLLGPDHNPEAHELQSSFSFEVVELKLRRDAALSSDGRPGRDGIPKRGILGIPGIFGMLGILGRFDMFGMLGIFGRLKGIKDELVSVEGAASSPVIVRCKCRDGDVARWPASAFAGMPVCGSRSGNG